MKPISNRMIEAAKAVLRESDVPYYSDLIVSLMFDAMLRAQNTEAREQYLAGLLEKMAELASMLSDDDRYKVAEQIVGHDVIRCKPTMPDYDKELFVTSNISADNRVRLYSYISRLSSLFPLEDRVKVMKSENTTYGNLPRGGSFADIMAEILKQTPFADRVAVLRCFCNDCGAVTSPEDPCKCSNDE